MIDNIEISKSIIRFFQSNNIKNINSFNNPYHCLCDAKVNAIIIPFCKINDSFYILVEKRSAFVKQPYDLSFPGGRKEDGEKSILLTALRECEEEIGLSKDIFSIIKYCGIFANLQTVIYVFVAMIKEKYSNHFQKAQFDYEKLFKINKKEVEKVIFFPFEKLIKEPQILTIRYKGEIEGYIENNELKSIISRYYIKDGYYLPYQRIIRYWEYNKNILWGYSADIMYCVIKNIKKNMN